MCVSGCPYKKVYYNWSTGKSEKCILCYPRQETGSVPACFHVCVGRIRYLGLMLYDAERIQEAASAADRSLVEMHRSILLDPFDPNVVREAQARGLSDATLDAARKSPVYRFVKEWGLALPITPHFRTLPMLWYVPPLLPVLAHVRGGRYDVADSGSDDPVPLLTSLEQARLPISYMASLFAAGNEQVVEEVYRKLIAVRFFQRAQTVKDVPENRVKEGLERAHVSEAEASAIFRLTSMATFEEHFVLPPFARETEIEQTRDPFEHRSDTGLGFRRGLSRRW